MSANIVRAAIIILIQTVMLICFCLFYVVFVDSYRDLPRMLALTESGQSAGNVQYKTCSFFKCDHFWENVTKPEQKSLFLQGDAWAFQYSICCDVLIWKVK